MTVSRLPRVSFLAPLLARLKFSLGSLYVYVQCQWVFRGMIFLAYL